MYQDRSNMKKGAESPAHCIRWETTHTRDPTPETPDKGLARDIKSMGFASRLVARTWFVAALV
jgi:hypothetical protein